MNITIIGAGVVGHSLAEQLSAEGHRIAIVDRDRGKLRSIGEKLDVLCVQGNAGAPEVLRRAGIERSEMAIAVTDVDEVNLVVGMLAAKFGVKHKIARIRDQGYFGEGAVLSLGALGIDQVINPDPLIVDTMVRTIQIPGSYHIATLAGGQLCILGFIIPPDSPAAGLSLSELRARGEMDTFLVLDISRGDEVIIPKGSDTIEPGSTIHVLCLAASAHLVPPIIHATPQIVDTVIIAGASRVGVQLAEAIEGTIDRVVLIEPDGALAEEAAAHLTGTLVVHGDPADTDVLDEASLETCDLFCALADDDQQNIMSSLVAKRRSPTIAAVLVHRTEYVSVVRSLGIEMVINPRQVTVGEILMHVRRGLVQSVTCLAQGRAEILEMEVPERSPALKGPLKDLGFPQHSLLGAIIRNGDINIPTGESQMVVGDRIVVFALPDAIPGIEKLFTRRRWF